MAQPLRIAQVAPLYERVPPQLYGGTERVVSYLTEELVRLGHDVTLFASGDSQTSARLVPACPRALWRDPDVRDTVPHHVRLMEQVFSDVGRFDIIHFHNDYLHFPLVRRHGCASVTTLPGDAFTYHEKPGRYLVYLGRMSPEKRVDRAIEIARRSFTLLKIAAKIYPEERKYFDDTLALIAAARPFVEFVGEIDDRGRNELLGNAAAFVFPIEWPEPFGLVMIESLACGTPVIAWRRGSVPEVIEDGVTGVIVEDIDAAVRAVQGSAALSRAACRRSFETRFDARRMTADYVELYRRVMAAG